MEMHQLRYFAAVARMGAFSRGAQECRVAQPSLSQQILKLEAVSQVRQFCHSKGFQPEISCRSAQIGTVLAMVEAGLGISLIPEMALPRPSKDGIICRSLDGIRPQRTLALAWSGQRKPSFCVGEFIKFVRDQQRSSK